MTRLSIPFILFLLMNTAIAKSILISSFDPFNGNDLNNSRIIANKLAQEFKDSDIFIHHCEVRTVYMKSAEMLKDCLSSLDFTPDYVISFGETKCRGLQFETRARNLMKANIEDNDGVLYSGEVIDESAPRYLSMSLDLKPLYKRLSRYDKKFVKLSSNQGTFVCNNLSFLMESELEDSPFTFIHVPSHRCNNQEYLVERSVKILKKTFEAL